MGHLFRALNIAEYLRQQHTACAVFLNCDSRACSVLSSRQVHYETVDLADYQSDWESKLIAKYDVRVWINDRLDTDTRHTRNVIKNNIALVTFDDRGSGAAQADINVAALLFTNRTQIKGARVLTGVEYLIVNKEIDKYKRVRKNCDNIIVTLGGSDTYGVTVRLAEILKDLGHKAVFHTGPSFEHDKQLRDVLGDQGEIVSNVPSLVKLFHEYDLAVTGGGVTPFEANAAGLPCLTVSCETHEADACRFLDKLGTSIYLGPGPDVTAESITAALETAEIEKMSRRGMQYVTTDGIDRVFDQVRRL